MTFGSPARGFPPSSCFDSLSVVVAVSDGGQRPPLGLTQTAPDAVLLTD
jgi:hypothetical protein